MTDQDDEAFLDSTVTDRDEWRDGIGYDLQALDRLGPEEQLTLERLLIEELESCCRRFGPPGLAAHRRWSAGVRPFSPRSSTRRVPRHSPRALAGGHIGVQLKGRQHALEDMPPPWPSMRMAISSCGSRRVGGMGRA